MKYFKSRFVWGLVLFATTVGAIWVILRPKAYQDSFQATVTSQIKDANSWSAEVFITGKQGQWIRTWCCDNEGHEGMLAEIGCPPPSKLRVMVQDWIPDDIEHWVLPLPQGGIGIAKFDFSVERKEIAPGQWSVSIIEGLNSYGLGSKKTTTWTSVGEPPNIDEYFEMILANGSYQLDVPLRFAREHSNYTPPNPSPLNWRNVNLIVGSQNTVKAAAEQPTN